MTVLYLSRIPFLISDNHPVRLIQESPGKEVTLQSGVLFFDSRSFTRTWSPRECSTSPVASTRLVLQLATWNVCPVPGTENVWERSNHWKEILARRNRWEKHVNTYDHQVFWFLSESSMHLYKLLTGDYLEVLYCKRDTYTAISFVTVDNLSLLHLSAYLINN